MKNQLVKTLLSAALVSTPVLTALAPMTTVVMAADEEISLGADDGAVSNTKDFAAGTNTTIIIKGDESQSLEGRSFKIFPLFKVTDMGSGAYEYDFNTNVKSVIQDTIFNYKGTTTFQSVMTKRNVTPIPSSAEQINARQAVAFLSALTETKDGGFAQNSEEYRYFMEDLADALKTSASTAGTNLTISKADNNQITLENLPLAFYLITETTAIEGVNHSASLVMVNHLNETKEIDTKDVLPTFSKKLIKDDGQTGDRAEQGLYDATDGEADDYEMNEEIKFETTFNIPSNYTDYEAYKIVVHDAMEKGLILDPESIQVTLQDEANNSVVLDKASEDNAVTVPTTSSKPTGDTTADDQPGSDTQARLVALQNANSEATGFSFGSEADYATASLTGEVKHSHSDEAPSSTYWVGFGIKAPAGGDVTSVTVSCDGKAGINYALEDVQGGGKGLNYWMDADNLPEFISFVWNKADGTKVEDFVQIKNDGATLEAVASGYKQEIGAADDHTFDITIDDIIPAINANKGTLTGTTYKVVVTYSGRLDPTVIESLDKTGFENMAQVEFSNNPATDGLGKTPENKTLVYTFQMDIHKFDGTSNEQLAGAEFKLYSDADCTKEIKLISKGNNVYAVDSEGLTGANDNIVTAKDANSVILGLDEGTYYLKEVKAPEGYADLVSPIEIKVTPTYGELAPNTDISSKDPDGILTGMASTGKYTDYWGASKDDAMSGASIETATAGTAKIANEKPDKLASTGSNTAILLSVAGLGLLAGAVIIGQKSRKENA